MLDQSTEEPEAVWLAQRREESCREALRVLSIDKSSFASIVDWAFEVLGIAVTQHSLQSVQKSYRSLMKKLHPDKAFQSPEPVSAVEIVQEAKAICERSLSHLDVPSTPQSLVSTMTCAQLGKRRFRLRWSAPRNAESAPAQRYVIAVAAAGGSSKPPHRVCTLEPDWSEELGRYVTLEEFTTYELSEEEMEIRMPGTFKQKAITVMVAAANKAGYSAWTTVTLELDMPLMPSPRTTSPVARTPTLTPAPSPMPPARTMHRVLSPARNIASTGAMPIASNMSTTTLPCAPTCTTAAPCAAATHCVTPIGVSSSSHLAAVQFAPLTPQIVRYRTVA